MDWLQSISRITSSFWGADSDWASSSSSPTNKSSPSSKSILLDLV